MRWKYVYYCCSALVYSILIASCSSSLNYQEQKFYKESNHRTIPYLYAESNSQSGKLLLVLPDYPDTNSTSCSILANYFSKRDYNVVILGKPGNDPFEIRRADSKTMRRADALSFLTENDSLWQSGLVLAGEGEGAYLILDISAVLKPTHSIILNSGVNSPLTELEYMSQSDSAARSELAFESLSGLNKEELGDIITSIKSSPEGFILRPNSNSCWLSYSTDPALNYLYQNNTKITWLNNLNYPMLSHQGLALTRQVLSGRKEINYKECDNSKDLNEQLLLCLKKLNW